MAEVKGGPVAEAPATVLIVNAKFGAAGVSPIDITVQARQWLHGTVLQATEHIWREVPHDWPGKVKWLEVLATVNGNPISVRVSDDSAARIDFGATR